MLLRDKTAIVHGAGGAIGGAVARAFAREGAVVCLAGRRIAVLRALADEITAAGGRAEAAEVDALDEQAVERHASRVADATGRIDACLNAISIPAVQGTPLLELPLRDFSAPITAWTSTQLLTARAAARHMINKRQGVLLILSASPARLPVALTGGFGVACAAVEGLSRTLAAELAPHGVRVVGLRSHRIDDSGFDADLPMPADEFRGWLEAMTLLKRLPTLAEVANTAAFLASDHADAMTATVTNLTCGMSMD
jgi:NAD(P)-dependent dehydrogenase (short-subunit alcohol dehydrogenase family)